MSLINQMLRDLEKRNAETGQSHQVAEQVHVTAPPTVSKLPVLGWNLLAAATIFSAYYGYQHFNASSVKPAATSMQAVASSNAAVQQPIAINATAPATSPTPPVAVAAAQVTPVIAPAPIINAAAPQPALNQLQAKPIEPEKLTQPPEAMQGAAQIAPVPAFKPRTKPKPVQVKSYLQIDPVDDEQEIAQNYSNAKPIRASKANPKQHAELLYREALNSGQDYLAIPALERALEFYPQHLNARLLLARTLHRSGQINKTANFLDESLALFPSNMQFINTRAQLYLQQKNPSAALNTLQRVSSDGRSEESYLSLLAATYQQLNSYSNAGKVYQRLVVINPAKAENWLGLAISAEKSADKTMAIEAYQQALSRNSLKPSVVNYIKQRLNDIR